jgi:hypothetical protein
MPDITDNPLDGRGAAPVEPVREISQEAARAMLGSLHEAERFMAGFEDDELNPGVAGKLARIRAAIAAAEGR